VTHETDRRQEEETIVPVRPTFGADAPAGDRPARARYRPPLTALVAIVLIVLVAVVFFALPRWVEERAERPVPTVASLPAPETPAVPEGPVLSPEERAALREEAESRLAELLQQSARLQARSVGRWGGEALAEYDRLSRSADEALLADDVRRATDNYAAALAAGEALLARSGQIIASALAAGAQALAAGDARLAGEQYALALGIEPENPTALAGKARAERLPEVLDLVQRAAQARQAQSFDEAVRLYREALAIDGEFTPARTSLAELTASLERAKFDTLLSRGFAALAEEEYADAAEHFRAALALEPGSQSAADGFTQADQGAKLDAIALAEARALAFERRELWDQAVELYETALERDATLAFATEGLARARARSDLDSKLENLLDNPNLLLTENVLEDARRLADEARALAEPQTQIADQVRRLDELVRVASTPVPVKLESDGVTEVTVYRVGRLGAFATMDIEVRPGTYTAVGSRSGYRDVRRTFTVLPGRATPPIAVVCSEPI